MSNIVQLDFFKTPEECEMEALRLEMASVKEMANKVRKSHFATRGELYKMILDIEERMKIIERGICQK